MQKKTGAILLVAGTCIGSGMIALPMSFARIGIIPSVFLMFVMWGIIYYSAILNLELNLQAGKAMNLGSLAKKFSGNIAKIIGTSCHKILSFSLVAVYIYASTSLLTKMMDFEDNSFLLIATIFSLFSFILMILPIKFIDYVNRVLFIMLMTIILFLVLGLITRVNWSNLPLFGSGYNKISSWVFITPIAFSAFGFHGSLATIINYCDNERDILKKVFLWGCFIPSIVYIVWTLSIMAVIYNENHVLFLKMQLEKVEVGEVVSALVAIIKNNNIQIIVWWISLLAIVTSLIGVGASLRESIQNIILEKFNVRKSSQVIAAFLTIFPSYIMAIWIPNAFLKILGFAGMILVVIAILLPIYLLSKINPKKLFCEELKDKFLVNCLGLIGIVIILSELLAYL